MNDTQLQHEADELDLAMLRVSSKMLGFAELLPRSKQRAVRDAATQLGIARGLVREHMIPEVTEANARLIAAAPDMLEALMAAELVLSHDGAHEGSLVLLGIRAAIAKAGAAS